MLLIILATVFLSTAYTMWYSRLEIDVSLETGYIDPLISSSKLLCCHTNCSCCNIDMRNNSTGNNTENSTYLVMREQCKLDCKNIALNSVNSSTVRIFVSKLRKGHSIWVGLVISNNGTLPAKIENIMVKGLQHEDKTTIYIYGPLHAPGTSGVWSNVCCKDLPFPGNTSLPSNAIYSNKKLIAWIHIKPVESLHNATITITVKGSLGV